MFGRKTLMWMTILIVISVMAYAVSTFEPMEIQSVTSSENTRSVESNPVILSGEAIEVVTGDSEQRTARVTFCESIWQGNAALAWNSWFTGQEYYSVYQDPTETGCPVATTYPFEVQNVIWHVFNPTNADVVIDMQPVIFSVDDSDPLCQKPGPVCCYGPLYTVTVPVNAGGAIVTLPLDSGCCVKGPYFAGVWCPDFVGTGILGVVTDTAGIPGAFGNRTCASYNNYQGLWEDLIVDYGFLGNLQLWSDGMASDMNDCDDCAQIIEPGVDLWETPPGSFDHHFSVQPIPADFFNPGSDPFSGLIPLRGEPLQTIPSGELGSTDAIILRNDRAELPAPGASDVVQIEIIALSLVSTQPIVVTYNGGQNPELWDVDVCLSSAVPQQRGTMTIIKECCNGGTFNSTLPVTPKFIFTRQSDSQVRELDLGALTLPPIQFETQNGHWSHEIPPPFDLQTSPGMVALDHDCSPGSPEILIPPSSKFRPGFRTMLCEPTSPDDPYCGGVVITKDSAAEFELFVKIPMDSLPPGTGACCPEGIDEPCMETTEDCCENLTSGFYYGDSITCQPTQSACTCCIGTRGDLNGDGNEANILDLTFIVNRIFRLGPPPACPEEGDLNDDGNSTNILDLTFIVNRIFRLGPPPPPCP